MVMENCKTVLKILASALLACGALSGCVVVPAYGPPAYGPQVYGHPVYGPPMVVAPWFGFGYYGGRGYYGGGPGYYGGRGRW
jgi:hypothetical protein